MAQTDAAKGPTYDAREAREILANFLEERDPSYKCRRAAALDLLAEFAQAAKRAGFGTRFDRDEATLDVSHTWGGHAFLFANDRGELGICGNDKGISSRHIETIRYDRAAGMFTSTKQDAYRSQNPGEPQQRYRSALAELAQAVRDLIKSWE
jgi:hypothetical protein